MADRPMVGRRPRYPSRLRAASPPVAPSPGGEATAAPIVEQNAAEPGLVEGPDRFDPAEHTIVEVIDYLDEFPDDTARVLGDEMLGKNRATLIDSLSKRLAAQGAPDDVAAADPG